MLTAVWRFYRDGFREMVLGRRLWAIILIKLVVILLLGRLLFPDLLQRNYSTDEERAAHVLECLVRPTLP